MKRSIQIAPSILSGDFGALAKEAKALEAAGADCIHVDVMDGHFVPNLTFGPKALASINRATDLFLDVHLMMYNPYDYVERFIEAGADRLTFHFEATEDVEETLSYIHKCGCEAGLAFRPGTSHEFIPKFLDKCDLILLMTVEPGFGGQKFIDEVLEKIRFIRALCDKLDLRKRIKKNVSMDIQVDGGINQMSGKQAVLSGASVLVAGTHLYSQPDMKKAIDNLRHCAD